MRDLRINLGSDLIAERGRAEYERGDRIIRIILMVGFVADLLLEAYLLLKIWQLNS